MAALRGEMERGVENGENERMGWHGDEPVVVAALRFIVAWTHGSANQQQAHGLCASLGMLAAVGSAGISNER